MRFSMTAVFLIICIVIFSIFVANLANIVSTDKELNEKLNRRSHEDNQFQKNQKLLQIDDGSDHLMWFIQISDLHISIFTDEDRVSKLHDFSNQTLNIIRPTVVLASGDLTDAKDSNKLGSRQYLREWQIYQDILISNDVQNKTVWLDIRGNHDYFNVPHINSPINYFNTFSIQGKKNQRSYLHQITTGGDKYSFIAVDACLEPGPKRPFNFIGLLDVNETKILLDLSEKARRLGGNYTVWFGHYPTSCILSTGTGNEGIRAVIGKYDESYAYLSGHLHTQGGIVPHMYALQKAGFLELELGDWKKNRLFRVAAFDHGLFSFIDVHYDEWPIVLITNPKDALLNIPNKESPSLQLNSTFIRMLIFSPTPVVECKVKVGIEKYKHCRQVSENLFVVPWEPQIYKKGINYLDVIVKTKNGGFKHIKHPFSLDGTRLNFDLLARFALMIDACQFFQAMFGLALAGCVVPLCIFRIIHELVNSGKLRKPRIRSLWIRNFIKKLWILSSVDRMFIPIIAYCIYISIGPWSVGEIIDGHLGVIFVWGIFVNNAFLPGSLTYVYGFFQLTFCQFPLIFVYANAVYRRYEELCDIGIHHTKLASLFIHLPFIFIIFVEMTLAFFFWWSYGTLAFLLGPFRTWSIVLHTLLYYVAQNIPVKCLKSTISVWQS